MVRDFADRAAGRFFRVGLFDDVLVIEQWRDARWSSARPTGHERSSLFFLFVRNRSTALPTTAAV